MALSEFIYSVAAMIFAALIAFTTTPIVRMLAYKIGAIDVPRDNRRMHKIPIPRMGGLAIFFAFAASSLLFCELSPTLVTVLLGGLILVTIGIFDDVFALGAWVKLIVQIAVALIAVWQGLTIEFINFFGHYIVLGPLEIPVTVLWIVGLTNAINLIDGLDGLSCGVSAICSLSLLLVMLTLDPIPASAMLIAVLSASCLGFLPFNTNPAKIFMGDTGALFLGFTMAVVSIDGVFKLHAVISFMIPIAIFALPLFDTAFAFIRRLAHGKNPFHGDRGHIHHRLIDMGWSQRQSVGILYAVCGILGISAVMFTSERLWRAGVIILLGFGIFAVEYVIVKNPKTRAQAGLHLGDLPKNQVEASDEVMAENVESAENGENSDSVNASDIPDASDGAEKPDQRAYRSAEKLEQKQFDTAETPDKGGVKNKK